MPMLILGVALCSLLGAVYGYCGEKYYNPGVKDLLHWGFTFGGAAMLGEILFPWHQLLDGGAFAKTFAVLTGAAIAALTREITASLYWDRVLHRIQNQDRTNANL